MKKKCLFSSTAFGPGQNLTSMDPTKDKSSSPYQLSSQFVKKSFPTDIFISEPSFIPDRLLLRAAKLPIGVQLTNKHSFCRMHQVVFVGRNYFL